MNVTEIIRELKMTKDEFFPLANQLGFAIGERAIKVDDLIAVRLIQAIKQHRKAGLKKSLFAHEKVVMEDTSVAKSAESDAEKKILEVTDPITTKQFAELLGKPVTDVIAILVRNGIMATINQNLDFETVSIISEDLGYRTKLVDTATAEADTQREEKLATALEADTTDKVSDRPPIVVVMGHVDHGKTRLLDAIRKTNIVDQEAGGITQSIGAYQIDHNGRSVTFIDTPGHEAFTAMRSRGANVADLAILVIAADDGIKPQTIEAIEILEKAKLPFIVAINKIDKPEADIDRVKKELSEFNLVPEDWGGKTICAPVSAKSGTNIDDLIEMVLLLADLHKDQMQANADRDAVGTIIESRIDKDAGAIATVLVQTGTLRMGDIVEVGEVSGKIKAMKSWRGDNVKSAGPSTPVQFLGLKGAPEVGDILVTGDAVDLKKKKKKSYQSFGYIKSQVDLQENTKAKLKVILKADTLGSLEALVEALDKMVYDEVGLEIIKKGLGNFTEKDIDQAVGAKAKLIGFNVGMTPAAIDYGLSTQTTAESFTVIYKLMERLEEMLEELLTPEITYTKIGAIKLLAVFKSNKKGAIVGGRVQSGSIKNKAIVKVLRGGKITGEGTIVQLQANKKDVSEVPNNTECGMRLDATVDLEVDDILDVYETKEIKRTLQRTAVK